MALTATASASTRKDVIKILGMHKPVLILRCPNKTNIIYELREKSAEVEDELQYLVDEVIKFRTETLKTIIFCRTYNDCSRLYQLFKLKLRKEMTDPVGYPDISPFRLVDMFHAINSVKVKNSILHSFSCVGGRLRILIATVAFGMGIYCPDIRHIIHWGPPSDCESYIQETGRAGRDGLPAYVTLYYSSRDLSHMHIDSNMKDYCKNTSTCRRQILFESYDYNAINKPVDCKCCDLCAMICECIDCKF